MRKVPHLLLRAALESGLRVDREAGVIYGVAVITAGTTKVSGNGVDRFDVDQVTLQQVADAINNSEIGVKSRLTHPELENRDELPMRLGYVRNARVEGGAVRADMHFHDPTSTYAVTLMDLAENDPTSCGLSISATRVTLEKAATPTGLVLRVASVDAVDWVGEPAANPAGMLSAKKQTINLQQGNPAMNEKQKDFLHAQGLPYDATEEQIAAFIEALSEEQKAQFAALQDDPAVEEAAEQAEAEGEQVLEQSGGSSEEEEEGTPVASSARRAKPRLNLQKQLVRDAVQKERDRIKEIHRIALKCGFDQRWVQEMVDRNKPISEVRRIALDNLNRGPNDMPRTRFTVDADRNRESLNQAVQDAILLRAGCRQFVRFGQDGRVLLSAQQRPELRQAHERASEFRGHSIIEMGRRYLIALGYHDADRMSRPQLAELLMSRTKLMTALPGVYLAHSTGDFPGLLADTMGKVLRAEYALAPSTYQRWCRVTTAPDYKEIKMLQLSEAADLVEIPEGDEYTYGTLTESKETYKLSKYGKGIKFTREMLINDDLSAFDRVPRMMARAALRKVEGLAIAVLTDNAALSDGAQLFSTAHGNLATGVINVDNLGAARALMRRQTALGSDDPLELMPRFLIVPESKAVTAEQLVASTVDPAKSNATPNPFVNRLEVISSARLDINSTTQWYLAADPADIDTVVVAFLEGEETPVVEEEDEFDTDARKIKVRHNVVAKAIDYRGLVRSSGS